MIILAVWGLVVGAFARLALPGRDPLSFLQTVAIGLAGSFVAGILFRLLTGGRAAPGFLASLVFSVLILYVIRRRRGGGLTNPGAGGGPAPRIR